MATTITAITGGTPAVGAANPKQFQGLFNKVIPFTVTLTDATLPAQTSSQVDVAVPGAALGDFVVIAAKVDLAGGVLVGQVQAADVVTVTLFNTEGTDAVTVLSGGPVANGLVLKPSASVFDAPAG